MKNQCSLISLGPIMLLSTLNITDVHSLKNPHMHCHLDFSRLPPCKAGMRLHELIPCTKLFKGGD